MPQHRAKTPVPNPAYVRLVAVRAKNDQVSLFAPCDPNIALTIARRLGTRYAAA